MQKDYGIADGKMQMEVTQLQEGRCRANTGERENKFDQNIGYTIYHVHNRSENYNAIHVLQDNSIRLRCHLVI